MRRLSDVWKLRIFEVSFFQKVVSLCWHRSDSSCGWSQVFRSAGGDQSDPIATQLGLYHHSGEGDREGSEGRFSLSRKPLLSGRHPLCEGGGWASGRSNRKRRRRRL